MFNRYSKLGTTVTRNGQSYQSGLAYVDVLYKGSNGQSNSGLLFHTVQDGEDNRLDLLTYIYPSLGDPYLYCLVGWMNEIFDPLSDLPVGKEMVIPAYPINTNTDVKANTYTGD